MRSYSRSLVDHWIFNAFICITALHFILLVNTSASLNHFAVTIAAASETRRTSSLATQSSVRDVVSVKTYNPDQASEQGPTPAVWEFIRLGDLSKALTVSFNLSGTARPGTDYQTWQETVTFKEGRDTAHFAVLPLNDSESEGDEAVTLTLVPGDDYLASATNSATSKIHDAFLQGFPGVFDNLEGKVYGVTPDLEYLDATIENGMLNIGYTFIAAGLSIRKAEFFIDVDQNPSTGDIRAGHMGGFEYRVDAFSGILNDWILVRLPLTDAEAQPPNPERHLTPIPQPSTVTPHGLRVISIPLSLLGNPLQVDVIGYMWEGGAVPGNTQIAASGDRVPNFGRISTATRQVVVRKPSITTLMSIDDMAGDQIGSTWDLRRVHFDTIADQFGIALELNEPIFRAGINNIAGLEPRGQIDLDSDDSLGTGGIKMGADIPTWGGDIRLFFSMTAGITVPTIRFQFDPSGTTLAFGQDRNDGRWIASNNTLVIAMSSTVVDAFALEQIITNPTTGEFIPRTTRLPTAPEMNASVQLIDQQFKNVSDQLGNPGQSLNTASGRLQTAYAFDASRAVHAADPLEFGQFLSAIDVTQVSALVIDSNLVLRVNSSTLLNTQTGNILEIWLDTDANVATGTRIGNPGQQAIGADFLVRITTDDLAIAPVTRTLLYKIGQQSTRISETLTSVRTSVMAGREGGYDVTIPLFLLDARTNAVPLLVTTGNLGAAGNVDIAPTVPLLVQLRPSRDLDNDRLPDDWEKENGLSPTDSADALLDLDFDSFSNIQEYLAGTNPKDRSSHFRILGLGFTANGTVVSFQSAQNRTYFLEKATNLHGSWSRQGEPILGDGSIMRISIAETDHSSPHFFRLRLAGD